MLRHILLFKWTEDAGPAERQKALDSLRALTQTVPEVRSLRVSETAGVSPGFDGLLEIEVDDADAFGRYVINESHQQTYVDALKPVWADMAAIQVAG